MSWSIFFFSLCIFLLFVLFCKRWYHYQSSRMIVIYSTTIFFVSISCDGFLKYIYKMLWDLIIIMLSISVPSPQTWLSILDNKLVKDKRKALWNPDFSKDTVIKESNLAVNCQKPSLWDIPKGLLVEGIRRRGRYVIQDLAQNSKEWYVL